MNRRLFLYSASVFGVILLFINKYFINNVSQEFFCKKEFEEFINSIPQNLKSYNDKAKDVKYIDNKIQKIGRISFEDFEDEILKDYKLKKTIQVSGWVLTRTEINLIELKLKSNCR
tara:strand:+ start:1816 stop:2163 length:348 start_codon:yes stop_codon:yes gene_type:complete